MAFHPLCFEWEESSADPTVLPYIYTYVNIYSGKYTDGTYIILVQGGNIDEFDNFLANYHSLPIGVWADTIRQNLVIFFLTPSSSKYSTIKILCYCIA